MKAPHFCAGLVFEGQLCIEAAPILGWARGKRCRVGGKLHRAQPLLAPGSQQPDWAARMHRRCDEPWIRLGRVPTDWAIVTVSFCFVRGQRGPELLL